MKRPIRVGDVYRTHKEFKILSLDPFIYEWENEGRGAYNIEGIEGWIKGGIAIFIRNENKEIHFNSLYEKLKAH